MKVKGYVYGLLVKDERNQKIDSSDYRRFYQTIKIGYTTKSVWHRAEELSKKKKLFFYCPFHSRETTHFRTAEKSIHKALNRYLVPGEREYFRLKKRNLFFVIDLMNKHVDLLERPFFFREHQEQAIDILRDGKERKISEIIHALYPIGLVQNALTELYATGKIVKVRSGVYRLNREHHMRKVEVEGDPQLKRALTLFRATVIGIEKMKGEVYEQGKDNP